MRVLLKRCLSCQEYTLQETCPRCGGKAQPNRPPRFSPEDRYGAYRRRLRAEATAAKPADEKEAS